MAKRHIIPMGKHKPLGSSWQAMDVAYSHSYEPEQRPEFRCFASVNGQFDNMAKAYAEHKAKQDKQDAINIIDDMLSNY